MDYLLRNFPEFAFSFAGAVIMMAAGLGLAVRFAIKPVMDAWLRIKESATPEAERGRLDRRLALVEAELQSLSKSVQALRDAEEFRSALGDGRVEPLAPSSAPEAPLRPS